VVGRREAVVAARARVGHGGQVERHEQVGRVGEAQLDLDAALGRRAAKACKPRVGRVSVGIERREVLRVRADKIPLHCFERAARHGEALVQLQTEEGVRVARHDHLRACV